LYRHADCYADTARQVSNGGGQTITHEITDSGGSDTFLSARQLPSIKEPGLIVASVTHSPIMTSSIISPYADDDVDDINSSPLPSITPPPLTARRRRRRAPTERQSIAFHNVLRFKRDLKYLRRIRRSTLQDCRQMVELIQLPPPPSTAVGYVGQMYQWCDVDIQIQVRAVPSSPSSPSDLTCHEQLTDVEEEEIPAPNGDQDDEPVDLTTSAAPAEPCLTLAQEHDYTRSCATCFAPLTRCRGHAETAD
jgi:hypothetical protein